MSIPICGKFVIAVLGLNVVAQKAGCLLVGVGDQGLVLGEFELERLVQVPSQLVLDLLGFCSRSGKPQQDIICLPNIAEPAVGGIVGIF